jgi:hypothetical protein
MVRLGENMMKDANFKAFTKFVADIHNGGKAEYE